jgi:hypothetical protein
MATWLAHCDELMYMQSSRVRGDGSWPFCGSEGAGGRHEGFTSGVMMKSNPHRP